MALQGLLALFPEAQQRGRVPRVRKEGRGAEILLHGAAFHRAELCENRVIRIMRSYYLSMGSSPNSTFLSIKGGVHHDYQRGRSVQGNCIAHH